MKKFVQSIGTGLFLTLTNSFLYATNVPTFPESINWDDLKPGWNEVQMDENHAVCGRGAQYSFFIYPGNKDKIIFDFLGGGACWNADTCAPESATFVDNLDYLRDMYDQGLKGHYDKENTQNELKDWTHVVIGYCTGDIHWGEKRVTYTRDNGTNFTINHYGAKNVKAVLNWVDGKIDEPENIFTTGCSAGSYGSIYWSPTIKSLYPNSKFRQLGDSGAGVITEDFFRDSFSLWNPMANAPVWIDELDPNQVNWFDLSLPDLYTAVAGYYPDSNFAQINSVFDDNQTFFYELMGGAPEEWQNHMYENINKINQKVSNFSYYIAPGSDHCFLPFDRYYTTVSNNKKLSDWVQSYAKGERVASVQCQGDECDPDGIGDE